MDDQPVVSGRYVAVCMEANAKGAGWPDRWTSFDTIELAEAALEGICLADIDGKYGRIWDRVDDCFTDDFAAEQDSDDEDELAELAVVRSRVGADLPAIVSPRA